MENSQYIFDNKLDGIWDVRVTRIDERKGNLSISKNGESPIHEEEVNLSYGALFGADRDDIQYWMDRGVEIVDKLNGETNMNV